MDSPLLMTKVHIPPTLPRLVTRSRLLTALDADLAQRRITLLSAPAGYGKTTLVAAWINHRRALEKDGLFTRVARSGTQPLCLVHP